MAAVEAALPALGAGLPKEGRPTVDQVVGLPVEPHLLGEAALSQGAGIVVGQPTLPRLLTQ